MLRLTLMLSVCGVGCDSGGGDSEADSALQPDIFLGDAYIEPDGPPPPPECTGGDDECGDDQYCRFDEGAVVGQCITGCRAEPDNCPGRTLCGPDRRCIPDPTCLADNECNGDEYCDEGTCRRGCRVGEFDACAPLPDGQATRCDPEARECTQVVICCAANDACSETLPSECDDVVAGARFCVNPNPCENRCRNDDSCADEEYCDDSGHCATGCRVEDRRACPGEVCDPMTRECSPANCADDLSCDDDQFCDTGSSTCVLGCRNAPDNCPEGEFCNGARQCVEGCVEDAQCIGRFGEGWLCSQGRCEPACVNDDDCDNGELCLGGRCQVGCRDDALEDNDDEDTALPLQFPGQRFDSQDLVACPQDADWFTFDTPGPGWDVSVEVDFRHESGDLDLRIVAPNDRVFSSASRDDDESVVIENAPDGRYAIEIFARGVQQNSYDFSIVFTPSGVCAPDAAEPGDNSPQGATVLGLDGQQVETVVRERTVCGGGDEDWYQLTLGSGDGIRVELTALGDAPQVPGELDFAIYGPGAPAPDAMPAFVPNGRGGGEGGDPPFVVFEAPRANPQVRAGEYFVSVNGAGAAETGAYLLAVSLDRARPLCLVDDEEPNEDANSAVDLMEIEAFTRPAVGGGTELRPLVDLPLDRWLCEGDEDWYEFTAAEGDTIVLALDRSEPLEGAVELELLQADGTVVARGENNRALNVARGTDLAAGTYRARIAAGPGVQAQYTLRLNRDPGADLCEPDRFEAGAGNDNRGVAAQILPGNSAGLSLCGADADFYRVELVDAGDLAVAITFDHDRANLELDIFRDDEPAAENADSPQGHSADDNERVELPGRSPGRYTIRVTSQDGRSAPYDLAVEFQAREFICPDDPLEPNDEQLRAVDLGDEAIDREGQWLCDRVPAESDYFVVQVPANSTRTIAADFIYGDDGDLQLEAYNADGDLLANTGGVTRGNSKQCLVVDPHIGDRPIFVRVVPLVINDIIDDDEQLDYRLRIRDGDVCDDLPPAAPGVVWPHVPPPF